MSGHMKARHTKINSYIKVTLGLPGNKTQDYKIPNLKIVKDKLTDFLKDWSEASEELITPWEQATPWENLAADRVEKYIKSGIILRGARYREGLSQKELAKRCGISQDNLSRMENGKRVIGEKTAKKLAKALNIDSSMLLKE